MRLFLILALLVSSNVAVAAEFELNGHRFTVPDGFGVEHIAGSPLVDRPVSADFDERGRLYVTDSSGSNEPVEVQREKRPHRIVRLEDSDGDGRFDKSTVFADKLMFPEGSMWFDGSLYVAAPPEIWKFTDADDDGVAEKREVWFDGKTLTYCANDLHGPYLGPDGRVYWCKGAFAEQTHQRPGKSPLVTRAAHIFRSDPHLSVQNPGERPLEMVMTGGMDNPVEIVFTPGGERIFTTTFLTHPNQGQRDGLIHAVYGGVYGKDHGPLDNHPHTGDLMPALAHLGAAAPCGLTRLESDGLGAGFQNNLLACLFNMHKITRHVLRKHGATFDVETTDLLVSDNLDFHPTDVLEDADGSVVVVDTGGWFRLCCPTSQLEKADVLGGIYRLRRLDAKPMSDPRGQKIDWPSLDAEQLVTLLGDERFAVRKQARQRIRSSETSAVPELMNVLSSSPDANHRREAVWSLTQINNVAARTAVRSALADQDESVRQAALHSVSVTRDRAAATLLRPLIQTGPAHCRRVAAEALGRVGSASDIPRLLDAVPTATLTGDPNDDNVDRFLEHSLIYAAMDLGDPNTIRKSLASKNARVQRAALIALDQLEGADHVTPVDIESLLVSDNDLLNETAWWIAEQHPDWGETVVEAFRRELEQPPTDADLLDRLRLRLQQFAGSAGVQHIMASALASADTTEPVRLAVLEAMAGSGQKPVPAAWAAPLLEHLSGTRDIVLAALTALNQLSDGNLNAQTVRRLGNIADDQQQDPELRLRSLNLLPASSRDLEPATLEFVCSQLEADANITNRALSVDLLKSSPLDPGQLQRVARQLPRMGAMELQPLMDVFAKSQDKEVGTVLVTSLVNAPAATSLFPDRLKKLVAGYGDAVADRASPLLARIEKENQSKLERVEQVLALMPKADVRNGLRVFQSTKASCIACHRRGYIGGNIGPDLNRIGTIRTERDLLESILFPSLSFVRSYEPVSIVTDQGQTLNGLIRNETESTITLQLDAQKTVTIDKSTIDERRMGAVSIMPAGLEKQLTPQDLADLVRYLKEG